jgi:hypothetical protein
MADKQVASDGIVSEIPGARPVGEQSTEPTPIPSEFRVDADPRTGDITEEVKQSYRLTFTRGAHSSTFEFPEEPSDAVKAEYRKQAEDIMDRLEAQKTQELEDRRKPKET